MMFDFNFVGFDDTWKLKKKKKNLIENQDFTVVIPFSGFFSINCYKFTVLSLMIILINCFLNSKLDLIQTVKFVKQLFRIQIQKDGKVLLWNQVKSRMEACYSELILISHIVRLTWGLGTLAILHTLIGAYTPGAPKDPDCCL